MTFKQIKMAIYATYLTNYYGFKLKRTEGFKEKKKLRVEYSATLLEKLKIDVEVINKEKLPKDGQYLLVSNHRSITDPIIIETVIKDSNISGHWIAKKELYNSFFFGLFTRNAGTILLDRESDAMGGFFKDIKEVVSKGDSVFIFPEGTRNKSDKKLGKFQGGARLIAVKNRLDMLPVYIRSDANGVLMDALKGESKRRTIEIEIGDVISYKDKSIKLEENYKKQFNIVED